MNLTTLIEELKSGVAVILFDKVGGGDRVIQATLDPKLLPEATEVAKDPVTNGVLAVWDKEINEWRSMRVENIRSVNGGPFLIA